MQRPNSVLVFGILNIVFGAVGLFGACFTLPLLLSTAADNPAMQVMQDNAVYRVWMWISVPLGIAVAGVLLAAGIGLVTMKPWARRASIGYSIYALVAGVGGIVINVAIFMPAAAKVAEQAGGPESGALVVGAIAGTFGGCIGMVYPVVLLIFMTRPWMVAAFQQTPATGELAEVEPVSPHPEPRAEHGDPTTEAVATIVPYRNAPALIAYYLAVFSLIPCAAIPLGITAVVLGILGLKRAQALPEAKGKVHAWIGIIGGGLLALLNIAAVPLLRILL